MKETFGNLTGVSSGISRVSLASAIHGSVTFKRRNLAAAIFLLLICAPLRAAPSLFWEGGDEVVVFDVQSVSVDVQDNVSDNCLPNPASIEPTMEAALRKNNFRVLEKQQNEGAFWPAILLKAKGFNVGSSTCAVAIEVSLMRTLSINVPVSQPPEHLERTLFIVDIMVRDALITGDKDDVQQSVENHAAQAASDLRNYIERARSTVKANWPILLQLADYGPS